MNTSPDENPVPGVVSFTAHGNAALDQLVEVMAANCDGSATSMADILERVLEAEIEDLAESLSQVAPPATPTGSVGLDGEEVGPPAESPDDAARRRFSARAPDAGGTPRTPSPRIAR